jgi:hypothetical protein
VTVGVTGGATPEEVATVLAVLTAVRRVQQEHPYERWRSGRVSAVSPTARQSWIRTARGGESPASRSR